MTADTGLVHKRNSISPETELCGTPCVCVCVCARARSERERERQEYACTVLCKDIKWFLIKVEQFVTELFYNNYGGFVLCFTIYCLQKLQLVYFVVAACLLWLMCCFRAHAHITGFRRRKKQRGGGGIQDCNDSAFYLTEVILAEIKVPCVGRPDITAPVEWA